MRIAIVDDDAIVAQSLATILGAEPDIAIAGLGASGEAAVELFEREEPDVLLMDIRMEGGDGLAAGERILRSHPDARIVFLTTFSDDDYIVRALKMGACGYLIKQDIAQIAPALRSVMAGMSVLEGAVLARTASTLGGSLGKTATDAQPFVETAADEGGRAHSGRGSKSLRGDEGIARHREAQACAWQPSGSVSTPEHASDGPATCDDGPRARKAGGHPYRPERFSRLTEREYEIVEALAAGLDNAEIAQRLFMGEGTVRNHISSILSKLDLKNRTQIAVCYYRSCTPALRPHDV